MQKPCVAVVGYGGWGRQCHCYLIRLTPGLELRGVVSGDEEKQRKIRDDLGCFAYASLDEALNDAEVDVIVLATPNHTHCDMTVRALEAGKHVVTDKVMCLSLEECDRMIDASKRAGKLLTVFQNRRRDGDFLTLQKLMQDGELGSVRWIEMAWQGMGSWGGWRGKAETGGGRYYDLGAHLVDQMLVLFSQPVESVFCRTHHDFSDTNVESEALLVIGFEGGATGICDLSSQTAISKARFYAHGERATWQKFGLDPQENAMKAGDIDSAREDPATFGLLKGRNDEKTVRTLPGRWRDYYENLAQVLTSGAKPIVQIPEMRRVMTVLEAGLQSARTGQVVYPGAPEATDESV